MAWSILAGRDRLSLENGMDLHLTINMELQERLDFILECELMDEETAGAVVVMNPKTGDIAGGGPGFFPALWALFPACSRPGGGKGCVLRKSCYTE